MMMPCTSISLNKRPTEFWKAWHGKFAKQISITDTFPGSNSDADVANKFAAHFKQVYYNSWEIVDASNQLNQQLYPSDASYIVPVLSVEQLKRCLNM
jgi:hypothetical protein